MKRTPLKRTTRLRSHTPLKRGAALKRKTPMRKASAETAAWRRKYSAALRVRKAAQIQRAGVTFCEICGRTGKIDGHHTQGRRGANILVFILVCRRDHDLIHNNGRRSRREGLLK